MTSPNFVAFLRPGTDWDALASLFPQGIPINYFLPSAYGGEENEPCYEIDTDLLTFEQIDGLAKRISALEPTFTPAEAYKEVIEGIGLLHEQIARIEWVEDGQVQVMQCDATSPEVPDSSMDAIAASLNNFFSGLHAALD